MATEWTQEERKQAGVDLKKMYRKRGVDMLDVAYEAVMQRNRAVAALERIRFVCSDAGHAPCRCGGIDEEGNVCPNACNCDWAKEIIPIVHAAIAACEKGDA